MPRADRHQLLRSGVRVSMLSAAWTVAASGTGIWIGVTVGSIALIAFGVVGMLDAAGSTALWVHFRLVRTAPDRADHVERVAVRIITAGLVGVGFATVVVSALRLLDHHAPRPSVAGMAIAGASMGVLAVLALWKRRLGLRLPSRALLADSHLSAVGAVLAAVTLAGTLATDELGWWWADPAAALCVAIIAVRLGVELARQGQPPTE